MIYFVSGVLAGLTVGWLVEWLLDWRAWSIGSLLRNRAIGGEHVHAVPDKSRQDNENLPSPSDGEDE